MILPLYHCCALGCMELIDRPEIMCAPHLKQVSPETAKTMASSINIYERDRAVLIATLEIAQIEGRLWHPYPLLPSDASQAKPQTPVSPSAAGKVPPQDSARSRLSRSSMNPIMRADSSSG